MNNVISQDARTGRVAAIYARVSSERQRQDETIASQTVGLRELAAARGLLVLEDLVFEDEGFSGASLQRPALERLRDRAAEGCFEVLLCHAPDRLARRYAYQVLLLEEFAHGTRTKVSIDLRTVVKEGLGHLAVDGAAEPIIHDIDAKPALRTFENRIRKIVPTHLSVQPFPRPVPDFEIRRQPLDILDDLFVNVRHAKFEAVRH
jgi:hypothetical protein